jgi:hypothetical protein
MLVVLFVSGWVRSYIINDNFSVASVDGVVQFLWQKEQASQETRYFSNAPYGTVLLAPPQACCPIPSPMEDADQPADALVPASYNMIETTAVFPAPGTTTGGIVMPERVGLDFDFNVPAGAAAAVASPLDPIYLSGEGSGFMFLYDEPMDGSGSAVIAVPYWFLIFPLAILSAIPLLWSRKPQGVGTM